MAKTINLNNIKISEMVIDTSRQCIEVKYALADSEDKLWGDNQTETYWVTLPSNPASSDVQLPANYVSLVTNLYTAALAALKNKYL